MIAALTPWIVRALTVIAIATLKLLLNLPSKRGVDAGTYLDLWCWIICCESRCQVESWAGSWRSLQKRFQSTCNEPFSVWWPRFCANSPNSLFVFTPTSFCRERLAISVNSLQLIVNSYRYLGYFFFGEMQAEHAVKKSQRRTPLKNSFKFLTTNFWAGFLRRPRLWERNFYPSFTFKLDLYHWFWTNIFGFLIMLWNQCRTQFCCGVRTKVSSNVVAFYHWTNEDQDCSIQSPVFSQKSERTKLHLHPKTLFEIWLNA